MKEWKEFKTNPNFADVVGSLQNHLSEKEKELENIKVWLFCIIVRYPN